MCSTVLDIPGNMNNVRRARPSTETRRQDSVMKLKPGEDEAKKAESQSVQNPKENNRFV